MNIRSIRVRTGLTQQAFAEKYHIPVQTLKQWESRPESTSYRKPPDYLPYLLDLIVKSDYPDALARSTSDANKSGELHYLERAAEDSRYDIALWFRYLRKEFHENECRLTSEEIAKLLQNTHLSSLQKIILERAVMSDSLTHRYVVSLNLPAQTPMVDEIMSRYGV